jgi:hypothetical protein
MTLPQQRGGSPEHRRLSVKIARIALAHHAVLVGVLCLVCSSSILFPVPKLHHLPQQRNPWWAKLLVTQYTALHAGESA